MHTAPITDVEMHTNGVLPKGGCQMKLGEDGKQVVFWKRAVHQHQVCFAKEHRRAITEVAYSNSHHHALAYDDVSLQ